VYGSDIVGPGRGGFDYRFPPNFRSLYGADLRGPGRGGFGPDFYVIPSGEVFEPFIPLEIPPALVPAIPWSKLKSGGLTSVMGFGLTLPKPTSPVIRWGEAQILSANKSVAWARLAVKEKTVHFWWSEAAPSSTNTAFPWEKLDPQDRSYSVPWGDTQPQSKVEELKYGLPPSFDGPISIPTGRLKVLDEILKVRYGHGEFVHPDWLIVWGQGRQPPTLVPNPTIKVPPDPVPPYPPIYVPPAGDQVDLPLECRLRDIPGDQVALPFSRYACMRSEVVVDNDVVLRDANGNEYSVLAASLNKDIESYADSFSASLPPESATLLEAGLEVEIEINGITFLMLVESWSKGTNWTSGLDRTFNIKGRSVSAELDAPYRQPRTHTTTEARTAMQLMAQELPIDGSWQIEAHSSWVDYTVPANTWSYTDLTPLQAISTIAAATGAVVQQVPGQRKLRILPRYPVDPWKQTDTEADTEIDFGAVLSASGEFQANPVAKGIYVAGEKDSGYLVKAIRQGTAGDPWLDIVTDPLITDPQAGLARARAELGASGKREVFSLTTALETGPGKIGLVEPGDLVAVVEDINTFWNAQAVAWSMGVAWTQAGLEVSVTTTVERYTDE